MKKSMLGLIQLTLAVCAFAAAPELPPEAKTLVAEYMQKSGQKIFMIAIDEGGRFAHGSAFGKDSLSEAAKIAMKQCDKERNEKDIAIPPVIYALNNKVVYEQKYEQVRHDLKERAAKERARREAKERARLEAIEKKEALIQADNETLSFTVRLDAFMKAWSKYESFKGPWDAKDEPFLLAALEKDPKGPWAAYISSKFAQAKFEARKLGNTERAALYGATLSYLKPACDTLIQAVQSNPQNKELHHYLTVIKTHISLASLEAGLDLAGIKSDAEAALANNTDTQSWNYGNIIYDQYSLLGRIALCEGKLDKAKKHLLAAGRTPGSPQLNSFGPDFILARELVEQGEYDTVLEFLDLVARFWANPEERTQANSKRIATDHLKLLKSWKQELQAGKVPDHQKWK